MERRIVVQEWSMGEEGKVKERRVTRKGSMICIVVSKNTIVPDVS